MNNPFTGSGVALVTPFNADFTINFEALRKLVRMQIEGGTDFLVVQGTTGESPTLSQEEKMEILKTVIDENNGRLKIVYGVGGNNTIAVGETLKKVPAGVDGILSVSPYYNKPIQQGIIEHYKYIATCTDLPIILYNVPGRTGSNMLAETTLELAKISNIVAMKEASGNMEQIMELIRLRPTGFGILSGDDALTMPLIAAGADGVISVVANAFPEKFSKMVHSSQAGDLVAARKEHYDLLPVTKMFFEEGNPGGVKVAMKVRGIMDENMRLPLMPVSEGLRTRITNETKSLTA
ncbi:MAG: 4-hydroxy-tetrahydrodipicolinate synthase [Crocinitomicaceae bacterium]|jgi:4-hydroxy-tetrahydrodipicolinate synthase|nr:4-hydroxy-tetrahydrodipicolinate synthase [Crocinitomicaceae bacterium]MDP4683789.1 4-hydroxy-tetrahydrodipicolinate synthase [Crocinitomicaceae bacterium]MDP4865372.1 4-hydroxy-tetrahydrodipicolinate synthase [Crocinitomicaceae bacterium]MDP5009988.1 4-hydroxy-tetrahydrodipicolinate synthase [Crocinitomicaceae bacterium]